jgi:hypothetical protein
MLDNIANRCSVKIYGRLRRRPRLAFDVAFCDITAVGGARHLASQAFSLDTSPISPMRPVALSGRLKHSMRTSSK